MGNWQGCSFYFNALKRANTKNTRPGRKNKEEEGKRAVLQYVTVKAYSLIDFKEFTFSANGYFVWTGGNWRAIPIVFVIK
jgi:hypothetical protein